MLWDYAIAVIYEFTIFKINFFFKKQKISEGNNICFSRIYNWTKLHFKLGD